MRKGTVEALYSGNASRVIKQSKVLLEVSLEGVVGDRHAGTMKKADGRDKGIVRGTLIRNWRQWSAVSVEELNDIASNLAIETLDASLLGPNLVISGIENFTALPKGTLLKFPEATLLVEAENDPCTKAGKTIKSVLTQIEPHQFVKAAMHKRGLVGVVDEPGLIRIGDPVEVMEPK